VRSKSVFLASVGVLVAVFASGCQSCGPAASGSAVTITQPAVTGSRSTPGLYSPATAPVTTMAFQFNSGATGSYTATLAFDGGPPMSTTFTCQGPTPGPGTVCTQMVTRCLAQHVTLTVVGSLAPAASGTNSDTLNFAPPSVGQIFADRLVNPPPPCPPGHTCGVIGWHGDVLGVNTAGIYTLVASPGTYPLSHTANVLVDPATPTVTVPSSGRASITVTAGPTIGPFSINVNTPGFACLAFNGEVIQ
jgi:hypothetical protein